ncbi:hypothetical protein TEA_016807 [Camellia sinensis var. sinensis]|uniref:Uncharacterized protein n=1 Tax=Camellia sinensis var. sinensis TaxID=542762 RepID=A0A4S4F138_CAMSN|nr:hypothetical protein TEA_016807 [Camellia sinensis var. sinensis]
MPYNSRVKFSNSFIQYIPRTTPHTHLIVDSPAPLQSPKSLLLHHRSRVCGFFDQASVALREVLGPPLLDNIFGIRRCSQSDTLYLFRHLYLRMEGYLLIQDLSVSADVETVAWDPHTEHSFVVSLENGTVEGFDIRAAKSDHILKCSLHYAIE